MKVTNIFLTKHYEVKDASKVPIIKHIRKGGAPIHTDAAKYRIIIQNSRRAV